MKKYLKLISFMLFVLFIYSCNEQEKISPPKEKENIPSSFTRQQMLLNVPWADRTVLPEGC